MLPPGFVRPCKKVRKHLSADALVALLRQSFGRLPDHRAAGSTIPLDDALLSAYALFALKDPSLLAFDERRKNQNLPNLFGIRHVPCDTTMREILDGVEPARLRPAFCDVFRELQRGKALEPFVFHEGCYLLALDGTGYFSSDCIHCDSCLEKTNHTTGKVTYEHQLLAAVLVHPDQKVVIPLAPEPIIKQDGTTKNDCERNAQKRLLTQLRQEHPHLQVIVTADALSGHAPQVRECLALDLHYLFGVKPGDHAFLFEQLLRAFETDRVTVFSWQSEKEPEVTCEVAFTQDLPLNDSNQDLRVNYLQYTEYAADGRARKKFSWITDLALTRQNAWHLVRGGRARWKIENETFNTLKNQGYHYEHNFGHGQQHLSVVFAMLMMLAFLVDQTQQLCCGLFQAVLSKAGSKRVLWEQLRSHFEHFTFRSLRHLYEVMLYDLAKGLPAPDANTS